MTQAEEPGTRYWPLVEAVWLPLNFSWDEGPDEFLRQFRAVRPEVGHLYAAHWCQSEICNGGLHQFFSNSTGILAPESLAGFRAIGLLKWAAVLEEAMGFFGRPYPRERSARLERLSQMADERCEERDQFFRLDERFYEWLHAEKDRWERAADAYASQFSA